MKSDIWKSLEKLLADNDVIDDVVGIVMIMIGLLWLRSFFCSDWWMMMNDDDGNDNDDDVYIDDFFIIFIATAAEGSGASIGAAKWAVTVESVTAVTTCTREENKWEADTATTAAVSITAAADSTTDSADTVTTTAALTGLSHAALYCTTRSVF